MKRNKLKLFGLLAFIVIFTLGIFFVAIPNKKDIYAQTIDALNVGINETTLEAIHSDYIDYSANHTANMEMNYCLRDDYVIYTKNQNPANLCWAFASSEALSTTLMMATGEYMDFSEAWVTLAMDYNYASIKQNLVGSSNLLVDHGAPVSYTVGGGGWFFMFDAVVKNYGVVLEQDFEFENLPIICQENKEQYYNYYSQFANKELLKNIKTVRYGQKDSGNVHTTNADTRNSIKYHIKNYGSLMVGIDINNSGSTQIDEYEGVNYYYKVPGDGVSGHAISIIGWDDTFAVGGKTGAWIALNQWGNHVDNDGIFYLMYEDTNIHSYFIGYKYEESTTQGNTYLETTITPEQMASESASYGAYTTTLKGKYYYRNYNPDYGKTKQRNMYFSSSVNLNYNYNISANTKIDKIRIYKTTRDVTSLFNFAINPSARTIGISGTGIEAGGYKLVITYTNQTLNKTQTHVKAFYVNNGLELSHVLYNFDSGDGNQVSNNGRYQLYTNYTDADVNVVVGTTATTGYFIARIYYSTYNAVKESSTNYGYLVSQRTDISESGKYLGVQINYNLNTITDYTVTLRNNSGQSRVITITILKLAQNENMVNVIYETNGGTNNTNNKKRVITSSVNNADIYAPQRDGYTFVGWYYDSAFENPLTKKQGQNIWLLTNSGAMVITSPTVSDEFQTTFNNDYGYSASAFLFAKWEAIEYQVTIHNNVPGQSNVSFSAGYGDWIDEPANPIRPGWELVGWYSDILYQNEWDFNSDMVYENTDIYAKWQVKNVTVYFVYENNSRTQSVIGYNDYAQKPADRGVAGYYDVWYSDSARTIEFDFNNTRLTELETYLYVKSILEPLEDVELVSSTNSTETFTTFTLTLDFTHELKNSLTISVDWYRNSTKIETTSTLTYNEKLRDSGSYTYYAVLTVSDSGNSKTETSNSVVVAVATKNINITNVQYGGTGAFSWTDSDPAGAGYQVTLKRSVYGTAYQTLKTYATQTSDSINVWSDITDYGYYYIIIDKVFDEESIGNVTSTTIQVVKLSFEMVFDNLTGYDDCLYDLNTSISQPAEPERVNYSFDGWFRNSNLTNSATFPFNITGNVTLYAKWTYGTVTVDVVLESVSTTYSYGTTNTLSVNASHSGGDTSFTYEWYKVGQTDTKVGGNTNTFTVGGVSDSGTYYCIVTVTDAYGVTSSERSGNMVVNISKAETIILTDNMRSYSYTGQTQLINSGARLNRTTELVDIGYYLDQQRRTPASFLEVPSSGYLTVYLYAPATDNYEEAVAQAEVTITQLSIIINAEPFQIIKYTGKPIIPVFTSNIDASLVRTSAEIKDVGRYKDVTLFVEGTGNYEGVSTTVSVLVEPANVTVRAKNITSLWLTDIKNLEYEVVENNGFTDRELGIVLHCNADKNKFGDYAITITSTNPNIMITQIEGVYSVIVYPHIILVLVLLFLIIFIFVEYNNMLYMYEFESNGGSLVRPIDSKKFKKTDLKVPVKKGYRFVGWYKDKALRKPAKHLSKGKLRVLYAKWEPLNEVVDTTIDERILEILNHYTIDQEDRATNERVKLSDEEMSNVIQMVKNSLHLEDENENGEKELTNEQIMEQFISKIKDEAVDGNISKEDIVSIISDINKE